MGRSSRRPKQRERGGLVVSRVSDRRRPPGPRNVPRAPRSGPWRHGRGQCGTPRRARRDLRAPGAAGRLGGRSHPDRTQLRTKTARRRPPTRRRRTWAPRQRAIVSARQAALPCRAWSTSLPFCAERTSTSFLDQPEHARNMHLSVVGERNSADAAQLLVDDGEPAMTNGCPAPAHGWGPSAGGTLPLPRSKQISVAPQSSMASMPSMVPNPRA